MPITAQKRPADSALVAVPQVAKRTRNDDLQTYKDKQLMEIGVNRVSNLYAPIMKLEGHESDIFSCEFHPDGDLLGKKEFSQLPGEIFTDFLPIFQLQPETTAKSFSGQFTARNVKTCR